MRLSAIVLLAILSIQIHAQKYQYYSMFWNTTSLFNPASSGVNYKYQAALFGHSQWYGPKDGPTGAGTSFDIKLNELHSGAGINFQYTTVGIAKDYNANANYNYQINLHQDRILSLGVSGGINVQKFDLTQIDDPLLESNDIFTYYDLKFGLLYSSKRLDIGLSSSHIKPPREFHGSDFISNYWMVCSYRISLFKIIEVQPNFLLITHDLKLKKSTLYSGLLLTFREKLWTGIQYTNCNNNLGAMIGFDFMSMFRLGYSISRSLSTGTNQGNGNHEIIFMFKM